MFWSVKLHNSLQIPAMFDEKYSKKFSTGVLITFSSLLWCLQGRFWMLETVAHFFVVCAKMDIFKELVAENCTFFLKCACFFS
jgi:hypothetical protein